MRKEWIYLVPFTGDSALKETRAGAQGLNMEPGIEAESMEDVLLVRLFALACLTTFLIQARSTPAGVVPSTVPNTLLSKRKMPHKHDHTPIWWGQLLN